MGERRRRHSESEVAEPKRKSIRRRLIPRFSSPVSPLARQRAFFIQARTLPHTAAASSHLHRLSVDFAHHPTLLLFEEAEVGERLLSHSSLGSWSTPSLSKLAVSDQVGAMLQGSASTCRASAYPTTVEFAHQATQSATTQSARFGVAFYLQTAIRLGCASARVRSVTAPVAIKNWWRIGR